LARRFDVKTNRHGAKKRQNRQQIFCLTTSFQNPLGGAAWRFLGQSPLRAVLRRLAVQWKRFSAVFVLGGALSAGCTPKCKEPVCRTGTVVTPDGPLPAVAWTDEELGKDVAVKTVRQADGASYHIVRLLKAERPHVHDRSDLVVVVLSGSVKMHFGDRVVPVGPGQIIDIPKGAPHWAENVSPEPSFAYVVFAPAFDGKDRRPVDDPKSPQGSPR